MSSGDDSRSSRLTTWTLGAIKQRNLALEGYCQTVRLDAKAPSTADLRQPRVEDSGRNERDQVVRAAV